MSRPLTERSAALRSAIDTFLNERLEAKLKGLPGDDPQRDKLRAQFERSAWIADAARRVTQIQLVTHTLKATHPGAQGSSLYAPPDALADHRLVGSHSLGTAFDPDVVGNAAALDVVQFLRITTVDGPPLLALMSAADADLLPALSDDEAQASAWIQAFLTVGQSRGAATSHTLAKQIYWLVGDDPNDDAAYHLLGPIHASSLAHRVFKTINDDRFGDAAKAARQARWDVVHSDAETHEYLDLAVQKLGGTKPQNISQLNSERRGVNYLLASLPPLWTLSRARPPLQAESIFPRFARRGPVKALLRDLRRFLESDPPPNQATRDHREQLETQIVDEFFELEQELRLLEPGWSALPSCRVSLAERCWLDPLRAESDPAFAAQREEQDWPAELCRLFANWLNDELSGRLQFDDGSFGHWYTLMQDELRTRQREGLVDV